MTNWQHFYRSPVPWQGRIDGEDRERFHQWLTTVDLQLGLPALPGIALLGFACDEGVRRNQGRVGAALGPGALRAALSSVPCQLNTPLYDVGDVFCDAHDLAGAQAALAAVTSQLFRRGHRVIVMGGGHEVAWGHYQGIASAFPELDLGIINFDAHYDLRPLSAAGEGSSGTPFTQIAAHRGDRFSYTCLGIQTTANTQTLFDKASTLKVNTVLASEVDVSGNAVVEKVLLQHEAIYVTLCLDVFAQAFAPGVSAPQALGLSPQQVLPLLKRIAAHDGPVFFDIAELSPPYDRDAATAKLAASAVMTYLEHI